MTTWGGLVALSWSATVNTLELGFVLSATTMPVFAGEPVVTGMVHCYYIVELLLYHALVGEL